MRSTKELQDILGITLTNYEAGGWGNTSPEFRLQRSIAAKFPDVTDINGVVTDRGAERAFNEIALKVYSLIENTLPVLARIPKLDWFTALGKEEQRIIVFKVMSFQADNNMTWEQIISSTISTSAMTFTEDANVTLTMSERIGMDAWAYIQKSSLWHMHVFDSEEEYITFVKDNYGNYEIIGKFDTDLFPVLN